MKPLPTAKWVKSVHLNCYYPYQTLNEVKIGEKKVAKYSSIIFATKSANSDIKGTKTVFKAKIRKTHDMNRINIPFPISVRMSKSSKYILRKISAFWKQSKKANNAQLNTFVCFF